LELAEAMAARTSSRPMPYLASASGLSSTRTAGSDEPPMSTSPTPFTWLICCSMMLDAAS